MGAAEWLEKTVRWGQVNFNEEDPRTLDVAWWVEFWKRCELQGMTLNLGGPVAFYPTNVPFHRRSAFLEEGRDLFGETLHAARGLGLRVLGRLDPGFANQELFDEHPDWCVTAADGTFAPIASSRPNPQNLSETLPELTYYACFNSPYFSSYIRSIIREVMEHYVIDGIFTNGWPGLGLTPPSPRTACYCRWCHSEWAKVAPDTPLPTVADPTDPVWRVYVDFVQSRVEDVQRSLRGLVIDLNPEASFVSTAYPGASTGLRWDRWIDLIDALGSDGQGRRNPGQPGALPPTLWEVGLNAEYLQAVSVGKPVIRFLSGYLFQLYRHASRPEVEMRLQMAGSLAHGERPKWHVLGGVQHDRRWMRGVAEFDVWMKNVDPYLTARQSVSDVGILWSPRSVHLNQWTSGSRPNHGEAISGWYLALLEARIPVDLINEHVLTRLHDYKVVILPSGLCLDDDAMRAVERYRAAGGRLIATCDAMVNDEWGQPRHPDPDLLPFGVSANQKVIGPLSHSYIRLSADKALIDLGDTDVIAGGSWLMPLGAIAPSAEYGTWIPDYALHPTHATYMPVPRTDVPAFVIGPERSYIRIAMDLDAQYNRLAIPDHTTVMAAAVTALLDERRSIEVEGAGMLDVKLWKHATSLSAFLVNLDTPAMYGGFATQIRSLGPQIVRIRLDATDSIERVTLRRCGDEAKWSINDDIISIDVPSINAFELVTIDLAHAPGDDSPT